MVAPQSREVRGGGGGVFLSWCRAPSPPPSLLPHASRAASSSSSSSLLMEEEAPPRPRLRRGLAAAPRTSSGGGCLELDSGEEEAAAAPRRRFLKPPRARPPAPASPPAAAAAPQAPPPGRTAAVLRRLAQIESRIRQRRQARAEEEEEEAGPLRSLSSSWNQPSHRPAAGGSRPKEGPDQGGGGRKGPPPDSKEEEEEEDEDPGRHPRRNSHTQPGKPFQNSQLNMPTRIPLSPIKTPSPPGRSSPKRLHHRAPSAPSRNTAAHSGRTSPSLSSSINDSLTGKASPRGNARSPSEGSIIRSLDELFSGPEDHQASSSSDFQVNVLSLADLAPGMANQKERLTEEATVMETSGSLSMELEPNLVFADIQSASKPPSATMVKSAALVEDLGETEISEQLSGSSVESSDGEPENSTSTQYSDDFDSLSEDRQRQSSSGDSRGGLDASPQVGLSNPSSPRLPPVGTKRSQPARRITTKEAAVQTNSPSLSPYGLKTAAATIDWIAEGPTTSSHVESLEALEELTTHRPAVSALNDMLKQNLLLIRQFVEASRHLHLSFVALLEEEEFHYHTLEEAKLYIDHHKSPPLTLEQALHNLEEQKQVAV